MGHPVTEKAVEVVTECKCGNVTTEVEMVFMRQPDILKLPNIRERRKKINGRPFYYFSNSCETCPSCELEDDSPLFP